MSNTGNPILDRLTNLEHQVFGASGPGISKTKVLTGSADRIAKSGIYLVASTVRDMITFPAPTPGPPGVGNDGEFTTFYNVSPAGNFHTITTPPPNLMHSGAMDLFQTNPNLVSLPFSNVSIGGIGTSITFLAYDGQLIIVAGGQQILYSWAANTAMSVGQSIMDSNGNIQVVTAVTGNQETGGSVPAWSTTQNTTTVDNNVTWTLSRIPT